MEKEEFIEILNEIEDAFNARRCETNFLKINNIETPDFEHDCVGTSLRLLHNMFKEGDRKDWIETFCFDLEFGKKYEDGKIKDSSGKNIILRTESDLYDLLTKEGEKSSENLD